MKKNNTLMLYNLNQDAKAAGINAFLAVTNDQLMNNADNILRINEFTRIADTAAHNANVFAKRLRPKSIANDATTNSIHLNIGNCIACCNLMAKSHDAIAINCNAIHFQQNHSRDGLNITNEHHYMFGEMFGPLDHCCRVH